jgi:hypothetical protein
MSVISKILVPNKEWILKTDHSKIGTIAKAKKGYNFYRKGFQSFLKDEQEIQQEFGVELSHSNLKFKMDPAVYAIYDYPCSSKPYESVYNLKKKLPLFAKSSKSKSQYCAGYYIIKFRKGWVNSFCPKLITLERYPYHGPYKTEQEMRSMLNNINKNETN